MEHNILFLVSSFVNSSADVTLRVALSYVCVHDLPTDTPVFGRHTFLSIFNVCFTWSIDIPWNNRILHSFQYIYMFLPYFLVTVLYCILLFLFISFVTNTIRSRIVWSCSIFISVVCDKHLPAIHLLAYQWGMQLCKFQQACANFYFIFNLRTLRKHSRNQDIVHRNTIFFKSFT
jgi:hypothetical protein